jgi:hypothetical protein
MHYITYSDLGAGMLVAFMKHLADARLLIVLACACITGCWGRMEVMYIVLLMFKISFCQLRGTCNCRGLAFLRVGGQKDFVSFMALPSALVW